MTCSHLFATHVVNLLKHNLPSLFEVSLHNRYIYNTYVVCRSLTIHIYSLIFRIFSDKYEKYLEIIEAEAVFTKTEITNEWNVKVL